MSSATTASDGLDSADEVSHVTQQHSPDRDRASEDEDFRLLMSSPDVKEKPKKRLKRKRASKGDTDVTTKAKAKQPQWKNRPPGDSTSSNESGDSDDAIVEALPDYIKQRREAFKRRCDKLKDAGLRIPPTHKKGDFSDDDHLANLKERPYFPGGKPVREYRDITLPSSLGVIPASIAQWLQDYQVTGAEALHHTFIAQQGFLLADSMGLGKTVMAIAFLTAAFGKTGDERDAKRMRHMRLARKAPWYPRVLIICPGTLFENWKAELNRWGWWHVDLYHAQTKDTAIKAAQAGLTEIMMTTYVTYRENKETINMVKWDAVIADECHIIKGRRSETTKAMNEVNSLCRIGLTGTAIQNSYDELWTLLNWANPGQVWSARTWKAAVSDPLRKGQAHGATKKELKLARETANLLKRDVLPQYFLRRTKTLIASQLPKKTDRVVFCNLTVKQAAAYQRFLDSKIISLIKTSTDYCDCGKIPKKKRGWCCHMFTSTGQKWQDYVFPCIATLQKLANHLAIIIPQNGDSKEKQEKDLALLKEALPDDWQRLHKTRDSVLHYSEPGFSGKWEVLKKLLEFWHERGDKILVFSQSVRLLTMLLASFRERTTYNVCYLDGSMSLTERAQQVDKFNADPGQFVFLISVRAGGVGLNLTAANKVVIFDPNWNPAWDLQSQDRAFRIGQLRDVEVFRLVSSGTIEERVYARQIYKQQQANIAYTASEERRYFKGVQDSKDQKGEIFGLKNLFSYDDKDILMREIVNKTNIAESKAGVDIVDVDMSQTDDHTHFPGSGSNTDEDAAVSQLAKLVTNGMADSEEALKPRQRKQAPASNPIRAILAEAGVKYTHENDQVVGTSKIEAHISRQARATGDNISQGRQHAFANTQEREAGAADDSEQSGEEEEDDDDDVDAENGAKDKGSGAATGIKYKYRPPEDVRKRQFCTMAKMFGYESAEQFALMVEAMTQEQRRNCLDRFYALRRRKLSQDAERLKVETVEEVGGEAKEEWENDEQ